MIYQISSYIHGIYMVYGDGSKPITAHIWRKNHACTSDFTATMEANQ